MAGSAFMQKLNAGVEAPPPPSYTVVSTRNDEVVTPYTSQALAGATNVVLQDRCPEDVVDHVGIIYDPIALEWVLNALGRAGPADPAFRPTCSDAAGTTIPFAFPKRPHVAGRHARVRVTCAGSVGRCAGRIALRDRRGLLGSAAIDVPVGKTRRVEVALSRRAKRKLTARVVTLQPGGWVSVKRSFRLPRQHRG
jgi:hypothetical protein